jgi:DNA-binding response OmpR family regulator
MATIMIVEDDSGTRNVLFLALSEAGYEVVLAAGGQDALAAVKETAPALVVLDLVMPHMDGVTFAAELRQRASDIPILLVTAHPDGARVAAEVGAAFLGKPFELDDLFTAVARATRNAEP